MIYRGQLGNQVLWEFHEPNLVVFFGALESFLVEEIADAPCDGFGVMAENTVP